jgi:hypothetical protein
MVGKAALRLTAFFSKTLGNFAADDTDGLGEPALPSILLSRPKKFYRTAFM